MEDAATKPFNRGKFVTNLLNLLNKEDDFILSGMEMLPNVGERDGKYYYWDTIRAIVKCPKVDDSTFRFYFNFVFDPGEPKEKLVSKMLDKIKEHWNEKGGK